MIGQTVSAEVYFVCSEEKLISFLLPVGGAGSHMTISWDITSPLPCGNIAVRHCVMDFCCHWTVIMVIARDQRAGLIQ
jgi:hypothetical protein